nr:TctD-like protein [Proteomonas sp. NEIS-1375]
MPQNEKEMFKPIRGTRKSPLPTVLLIDDDKRLVSALRRYLSDNGFQIITATSFQKGQSLLHELVPDVFIIDILLEGERETGYDFVKKIKKNPTLKNTPCVFLSAKGLTQDRIKGYELGCAAYISKPFDPEELVSVIKAVFYQTNKLEISILNHVRKRIRALRLTLRKKLLERQKSTFMSLTPREADILYDLLDGYNVKEIAQHSKTTIRNIEKYITRLLAKTNTKTQIELISLASLILSSRANDGNRTRE